MGKIIFVFSGFDCCRCLGGGSMNSHYDTYMLRGLQSFVGTPVCNLFRFQNTVNKSCMVVYDLESRLITKVLSGNTHVLLGNNESCLVFNNAGKLTLHFNPPESKARKTIASAEPKIDVASYIVFGLILIISLALMI